MWPRVGARAEAEQLAVDPRAARAWRARSSSSDQQPGPFAQHEAVALGVERAAGALRGSSLRVERAFMF